MPSKLAEKWSSVPLPWRNCVPLSTLSGVAIVWFALVMVVATSGSGGGSGGGGGGGAFGGSNGGCFTEMMAVVVVGMVLRAKSWRSRQEIIHRSTEID